jgi:hypothetical protein
MALETQGFLLGIEELDEKIQSYIYNNIPKYYQNNLKLVCKNWKEIDLKTNDFLVGIEKLDNKILEYIPEYNNLLRLVCKKWREKFTVNENGNIFDSNKLMECVAKEKKYNLVKFLKKNKCPYHATRILEIFVKNGNIKLFDKFDNFEPEQIKKSFGFINMAAISSQFDMMKHLKEKGYPFSPITSTFITGTGNLEVLKWATENGCPLSEFACKTALDMNFGEIYEWIKKNGCLISKETNFVCEELKKNNSRKIKFFSC